MPGFSLSLLLLPSATSSSSPSPYTADQILAYLDAPGDAPGWHWTARSEPGVYTPKAAGADANEFAQEYKGKALKPTDAKVFVAAIKQACEDVKEAEPLITKYDT